MSEAGARRRHVDGRVSVVVPTRNSARTLEDCLASVAYQHHDDTELIVVDNHSTDGTRLIAEQWADRVELRGPERSAQRNHGAAIATGEAVAFVDSDMVLEPGVVAEALDALRSDASLGGLVIPERAFGSGRWIGARQLEKDLCLEDAAVEAARVFPIEVIDVVGGYDETLVAAEDWDLTDRIRRLTGRPIGRIASTAWHDEGRLLLRDAFEKKRYYGRTCLQYVQRRHDERRRLMSGRWQPLVRQLGASPVRAGGLIVLKSVEAAGFGLGLLHARWRAVR